MATHSDTTGRRPRYRGRFAPSPTGPLHMGSLAAAIASYLDAHAHAGEWLVRIEDIDPPREVPGAADAIVTALAAHGFRWHGDIIYQSRNVERFAAVVDALLADGRAYACICSREQIRQVAASGSTGKIYPGTCRSRAIAPGGAAACSIRLNTSAANVTFDDRFCGRVDCDIEREIGDFIIRRKDGLIAYSLAVVVDDYDQHITDIVRGADLLDFTAAQICLQRVLGLATPRYAHIPVVCAPSGDKLSKQTGATAVDNAHAAANLVAGLAHLRQSPPAELATATPADVWAWASENWRPENLRSTPDRPTASG
ncbi:MAG: tRNA glutamyl-Q(34) synthetase GluQRS [Gammaproteobacteria bacterium]